MLFEVYKVRVILFDLGKTLEFNGGLLPGAKELLSTIKEMHVPNGNSFALGLVSDYDNFAEGMRLIDVKRLQLEYYDNLHILGISPYFEPLYKHVTLSTEVGVRKPDKKIFRAAVDGIEKDLPFENVLFITEDPNHISAARQLGIKGIHYKGPGQNTGDVDQLLDIVPLIQNFLMTGTVT